MPAIGQLVVINNGLAPPNAANVIDEMSAASTVRVRNVGCDSTVENPCALPWGAPTTVEMVAGAWVVLGLSAAETSTLQVSGGSVITGMSATDSATVTMSGGFAQLLEMSEFATVTMSGGYAPVLQTSGFATAALSDEAEVDEIYALGSSRVTVTGGTVVQGITGNEISSITIRGGAVLGGLHAANTSTSRGRFTG